MPLGMKYQGRMIIIIFIIIFIIIIIIIIMVIVISQTPVVRYFSSA